MERNQTNFTTAEYDERLIEMIARTAHEANRALCETQGDASQVPWAEAPEWQKQSAREGVVAHLEAHKAGAPLTPAASHEGWMALKLAQGWKWGAAKDPVKLEHPCLVPYEQLPIEQRLKDYLFGAIVAAFWRQMQGEKPAPLTGRTVGS